MQGSAAQRTYHEQLLDACEEGDLSRVKACLALPDVDAYLNLTGIARNIVVVRDPKTGRTLDWGHPELLACGRGDTPLRYAAFHGYLQIVKWLLDAGAVPSLRNDDCRSALDLAKDAAKLMRRYEEQQKKETLAAQAQLEEGEPKAKRPRKDGILAADLPRGDPAESGETIRMLEAATAQQWIVVNYHKAELNGRIAQISSIRPDGLRCAIVDDAEASAGRPFYLKSAVRSATLRQGQLRKVPPPKPPLKTWPLNARFCCMLAGETRCACAFGPCTVITAEENKTNG